VGVAARARIAVSAWWGQRPCAGPNGPPTLRCTPITSGGCALCPLNLRGCAGARTSHCTSSERSRNRTMGFHSSCMNCVGERPRFLPILVIFVFSKPKFGDFEKNAMAPPSVLKGYGEVVFRQSRPLSRACQMDQNRLRPDSNRGEANARRGS
jgi:hypothetical protein